MDAEEAVKETDEYLNDLQIKIQKLEDAIKTFEHENIPVPEAAYGLFGRYNAEWVEKSEYNRQLTKIISKLVDKHNITWEDRVRWWPKHPELTLLNGNGEIPDIKAE